MRLKIKILILAQFIIILTLLIAIFILYSPKETVQSENTTYPLLSSRISSSLLEQNSYLLLNYDPLETELT